MSSNLGSALSSGLTKMVQELVAAIQQTREAYAEVQELCDQIRSEGIPELEAVETTQDPQELYKGYEIQAQIQELRALNQDTLEAINEMVGLLLFIRSQLLMARQVQADKMAATMMEYGDKMDSTRRRYNQICEDKRNLVVGIRKRQHLVSQLQKALEEGSTDSSTVHQR